MITLRRSASLAALRRGTVAAAGLALTGLLISSCDSSTPAASGTPTTAPGTPNASSGPATSRPATKTVTGDKFTVALPGKADRSENAVTTAAGKLKTVTYGVQTVGGYHAIAYVDYPASVRVNLDKGLDGSASAIGGMISSRRTVKVDGRNGREAIVTDVHMSGLEGTAFVTAVALGRRMYTLVTVREGVHPSVPSSHQEIRKSLRFSRAR